MDPHREFRLWHGLRVSESKVSLWRTSVVKANWSSRLNRVQRLLKLKVESEGFLSQLFLNASQRQLIVESNRASEKQAPTHKTVFLGHLTRVWLHTDPDLDQDWVRTTYDVIHLCISAGESWGTFLFLQMKVKTNWSLFFDWRGILTLVYFYSSAVFSLSTLNTSTTVRLDSHDSLF